jgi:gag-polypeptide of LTR copia-type
MLANTIFNHVKVNPTIKGVWDELKKSYKGRTTMVQVDLQAQLTNIKCGEDEDVHVHLERMANMQEELALMGTDMVDHTYTYILLRLLPRSYAPTLNSLVSHADLNGHKVLPANVINLASNEYIRCEMEKKTDGADEAFIATTQQKPGMKNLKNLKK